MTRKTKSTNETNTTRQQANQTLVPLTYEGEPGDAFTPTIQDAGVDTIESSFDVEISEGMWEKLKEERLVAEILHKQRKAVHVPDWLNAQMSPTGARGGYHFLLQTPNFAVKLLRGIPNRPPIYVEMRAFGLHTHSDGAIGACEEACALFGRSCWLTVTSSGRLRLSSWIRLAVRGSTSSGTGRVAGIPPSPLKMRTPLSNGHMRT